VATALFCKQKHNFIGFKLLQLNLDYFCRISYWKMVNIEIEWVNIEIEWVNIEIEWVSDKI
jgi:hypothetical protein